MNSYKNIHIGSQIKTIASLKELSITRACQFLKCSAQEIEDMYAQESLDSNQLLRWCKLLEYNFFMFYHSHLQLYSPSGSLTKLTTKEEQNTEQFSFKKNLYSPEIIAYILDKWNSNELSAKEIIERYHIPRTTLYRWKKKESKPQVKVEREKKKVNYKVLYLDFIRESPDISHQLKGLMYIIIDQWPNTDVGVEKLFKINKMIAEHMPNRYNRVEYQTLNVYDEPYMTKVFVYQKQNNLSDLSISNHYQLSRNTIAKWKKHLGFTY